MLRTMRVALAAIALGVFSLAQAAPERAVAIGLQAAITSIDPHYHNLSPNNSMLLHVFEPLITRDPNQKLVPALATSWKALDDLTWEFKLRKNVKFHDGSPFTAADVVFTLNRVPNVPNSPSSFATFLLFAPENTSLRLFREEGQILPLGIRGEGLFAHLKALAADPARVAEIAARLRLFDWFRDLKIPADLSSNERALAIEDRYVTKGLTFD